MGYEKFLANHRKIILAYAIFTVSLLTSNNNPLWAFHPLSLYTILKLFFIFGGILYISNLAYTDFDVTRDIYWFRTIAAFIFFFVMVFVELATIGIIWSMFKQDPIAQHVFTHKSLNNLDSTARLI